MTVFSAAFAYMVLILVKHYVTQLWHLH